MLQTAFVALTWLIGIFGTGGAVAFVALAVTLGPSAVLRIVEPILSRFFGCMKCVVAVGAVLATIGAYWVGRIDAESDCKARMLASRAAAHRADVRAAVNAAGKESELVKNIEETAKVQHDADLAEIERLKAATVPACMFDDRDLDPGSVRDHGAGAGGKGASAPAKPTHKAATGPAPKPPLWLSMVRHLGLQRPGRASDAPSDHQ